MGIKPYESEQSKVYFNVLGIYFRNTETYLYPKTNNSKWVIVAVQKRNKSIGTITSLLASLGSLQQLYQM